MYRFTRKERAFLELQRVGRMALIDAEGVPRVTPLCHVFSKDVLYLQANGDSWKIRNVGQRGQVAYVVDEYTESWGNLRGIRLQGTVDVLRDGPEYRAAKRLLVRKYPQFKAFWDDAVNLVMKLTLTTAATWGL